MPLKQSIVLPLCTAVLAMLAACSGYDVKINDRVVYSPPTLFKDYQLADPALQACVSQHISDGGYTAASQLLGLNCSSAGITSLAGLETFSALQQLRLSTNSIADLTPLSQLAALQALFLDHNAVRDAAPLRVLDQLGELDLGDNSDLLCDSACPLEVRSLHLPRHCQASCPDTVK